MFLSSQSLGLCFNYEALNKHTFCEEKEYRDDPNNPGYIKEINPQTGEFWRMGEMNELTGLFCRGYDKGFIKKGTNIITLVWVTEESFLNNKASMAKAVKKREHTKITSSIDGHIDTSLKAIKSKCKLEGIPYNIDVPYMVSIAPTHCPVLGVNLGWCRRGKKQDNSPSIDRIIPELGYVRGNVQYLSDLANRMKQDATPEQLVAFAKWVLSPKKPIALNTNPTETEIKYLKKRIDRIKRKTLEAGRVFDVVLQDLLDILPTHCPVFGTQFVWGSRDRIICPSIDKIEARFGYTNGNMQIISNLANSIKNSASPSQLEQFARWVLKTHKEIL